MDYFNNTKEILDDIFLDKKSYLADLFLNVTDFSEFKNISQKSLGGILYEENIDIKNFTSGDYIAIYENIMHIYNFLAEKLLAENYYNTENSIIFLYLLHLINKQNLDLIQNPLVFKKNLKDNPIIFLPSSSFDFILQDKLFFDLISDKKEQINYFFKTILEDENKIYSVEEDFIEDFRKVFKEYVKEKGLILLEEQLQCVENGLKHKCSGIKGVAGSSKTFTSMLSLLACCAYSKEKPYKILVTGQTYKSVEESIKKLSEITKSDEIKKFLNKYGINKIEGLFLTSFSKEEKTKYLQDYSNETLKITVSKELKEFKDADAFFLFLPLPILTSAVAELDISTFKHQQNLAKNVCTSALNNKLQRSKDNALNFIYSVRERLKNLKIPYQINEGFNHIHIEEASQFSGVNLSVIGSILNPQEIYRFSFSGDPKQLSPVYNYKTTKINLLRIGAFYNLFTLFEDTQIKMSHLEHSIRNPDYIVNIIKDVYPEFNVKSIKSEEKTEELNEDFDKLIKDALPVFRLRYVIVSNKPYKNSLTTENKFETFIAKKIIDMFNPYLEEKGKDYFVLTLFKKQEIDLLKNNIKNCGTVDKIQGRETFLAGLITSCYDVDYISKVVPFIATPNRINVAITRTKKYFFMVMSKNLENFLYSYYSALREPVEFEIGYFLSKNKQITEEKSRHLLTQFDINLGIYVLQKFIEHTDKKVSTFYVPLKLDDDMLVIEPDMPFQLEIPEKPFIKIELFGLRNEYI